MQTRLPEALLATRAGRRADDILRACVHCGFCNATCPTYQVLGDELDGPRGRIYLIKDLLEGNAQDARVNQHLDRCLTCRACETTCPSGVRYGELLEIARNHAGDDRAWWRRALIAALKWVVPNRRWFRRLVRVGHMFRPLLPGRLAAKLPPLGEQAPWPASAHDRKAILLTGCVQSVATPQVAARLADILHRRGIAPLTLDGEGCCGALPLHLGDEDAATAMARHNVQRAAPLLGGVDAVLSSASGCGVTVKDYGRLLPDDPLAAQFADLCHDAAEYLSTLEPPLERAVPARRIGWSPPCTLQHGQRQVGVVEALLTRAGFELVPVRDSHLCCGSAGTYALLQPDLAETLRERKLACLEEHAPEMIATANIGCQTHLAAAASVPVVHWLELVR